MVDAGKRGRSRSSLGLQVLSGDSMHLVSPGGIEGRENPVENDLDRWEQSKSTSFETPAYRKAFDHR